jgi:hypothetical protein
LAIRRSKIWRYSREVKEEVITTALIFGAELWNENGCVRTDDTRGAWIGIGIEKTRRARWNGEVAAFGAECGRGVFTPGCGSPPGPKKMLGRKRPI